MIQTKFKVLIVQCNAVALVVLFVIIAVFEAAAIAASLIPRLSILSLGISITLFILILIGVLTTVLFMVEVSDSNISVRTRLGKRFSFSVSEITKVVFCMEYSKYNTRHGSITIKTANREVYIDQGMKGFRLMAEYILEKLENGEINEAAVSSHFKRRVSEFLEGKTSVT